jgi:hypothetical protein
VKITVSFGDARRGLYVVDARPDDAEVKVVVELARRAFRT